MDRDACAQAVLPFYAKFRRGSCIHLGNHGGFSGAELWRIESPDGVFCLKAWPADWRSPAELEWIHGLMSQATEFPWMPRVCRARDGATFVRHAGRLWELASWMPGAANYASAPSAAKLEAALEALAELHRVWASGVPSRGVCPAILRRQDAWRTWTQLVQSGWRPAWSALDLYQSVAEPLWRIVQQRIPSIPHELNLWLDRQVPLQPCVCDLWHDHVLFTDEHVTGIIDFGSVRMDHVAVDLARLLGSLAGNDTTDWHIGINSYGRIRALSAEEIDLARMLDRTGAVLAGANWLRWLYREGRAYAQPEAVAARLLRILDRLRSFVG